MSEKKTRNLNIEERKLIEQYLNDYKSLATIATLLNRGYSTISLEIAKNGGAIGYNAVKAQETFENIEIRRRKMLSVSAFQRHEKKKKQLELKFDTENKDDCDVKTMLTNLDQQLNVIINFLRGIDEKINNKL